MKNIKKTGILLVNLGTPDGPTRGEVYRYLKQFLLDPRVIDTSWLARNLLVRGIIAPFRSGDSAKLYQQLWTEKGSPIKFHGVQVTESLQQILPENYKVALGMRYQNPSIEKALNSLLDAAIDRLIVIPLFPQYASASVGSVHEEVMRLLAKEQAIPEVTMISSFPIFPEMIKVFADNARKYDIDSYDHILFSFHGLPERQLKKADRTGAHCQMVDDCCSTPCDANKYCYAAQCHQTAKAIAEEIDIDNYSVCYQSRLGRDPWVQPYTTDVLEQQLEAGNKKLLVFSPAFVADCLETTIEIGVEYKEEFIERGGEKLDLVESLNDNPDWIEALKKMILEQ